MSVFFFFDNLQRFFELRCLIGQSQMSAHISVYTCSGNNTRLGPHCIHVLCPRPLRSTVGTYKMDGATGYPPGARRMLSYVSIFDQLSAYDVSTNKVLGSRPELHYLPAELPFVQMNGVMLIPLLVRLHTYEPVRLGLCHLRCYKPCSLM